MNIIQNKLNRLNDLQDKYQYYTINMDNIYYWAKERYNVQKPTSKQLESICEYEQNYSDYAKIVDKTWAKMKTLIDELPKVEYTGACYRLINKEGV